MCTDGKPEQHEIDIQQYYIGILMAIVNGVFAATIMVPLHYAPPNATRGLGYSMSFGIAAVVAVLVLWILRWFLNSSMILLRELRNDGRVQQKRNIVVESFSTGYNDLPSFHVNEMWQPGMNLSEITTIFLFHL